MNSSLLNQVIGIVDDASKIMLDDTHFSIEEKDGASNIVTTNDVAVQNYLKDHLSALLPSSSFYCEENDVKDITGEYVWIIDPIDGTTNYSKHVPFCAISVGLEYKKEIILGVVYNPYLKMMFAAEKGKGATLNGSPIHVSNTTFNHSLLYTAFNSYNKSKSHLTFEFAQDIFKEVVDIRRIGTAAFELCLLAAGKGDLYLEIRLCPYDYAGASIVVLEAGGHISNLDGVLQFDDPGLICAANTKENHDHLIEIAKRHLQDQ